MSKGGIDPRLDMISDLAKLLRKYGPEAFEELVDAIRNPQFQHKLAELLLVSARTARKAGIGGPSSQNRKAFSRCRDKIENLKSTDPEKAKLLAQLIDDVERKKALRSMREIREFSTRHVLPKNSARTRAQAIEGLLESLADKPLEQLKEILHSLCARVGKGEEGLEGWANLIMRRHPPEVEGKPDD